LCGDAGAAPPVDDIEDEEEGEEHGEKKGEEEGEEQGQGCAKRPV
jgi:hypothetical protein